MKSVRFRPACNDRISGIFTMAVKDNRRPRQITLIPLADVSTEVQLGIREMRNEDAVRKWMFTDRIIELNEHLAWLSRVKGDQKQIIFVVINGKDCPVGIASVNAIDYPHKKADWAFYLAEKAPAGLGSALEFAFINFIFYTLDMQKLNCQVIEGNDRVVKLHKKFLFEDEGFKKSDIINNGKRIGVHLLGLTRKDWDEGKDRVYEKYGKSLDKYSISVSWDNGQGKGDRKLVDQIEMARARNNLNWMNILRLVLDLSPEHGKALIADIRDIDKEISRLSDKLVSE